jgi:hypothetical protein
VLAAGITAALLGTLFELPRERVGLDQHGAGIAVANLELVQIAGSQAGDEQFPDAGTAARAHGVYAAIPVVEAADHRDAFGIRRPNREAHTIDAIHLHAVAAQAAPGFKQFALVEQVHFLI